MATDIKLVDVNGGIADAIEIAKNMANLTKYRIVELPEIEDPIQMLIKSLGGEANAYIQRAVLGEDVKYLKTIQNIRTAYPIQARMPYDILMN